MYNPNQPEVLQKVRAILDLGSQRSYISQRAAKLLRLKSEGVRKMTVFMFESTEKKIFNSELVHVMMKTLDGEIEIHLLTNPIICEPLSPQPLDLCVNSYRHLSGLQLADCSDGNTPVEVNLLIGSDYYWQLATGQVSRGDDGPIAVETKMEWVLSGPGPIADYSLLTTQRSEWFMMHQRSLAALLLMNVFILGQVSIKRLWIFF